MYRMILAAVAFSLPIVTSPASAAVNPVWSELGGAASSIGPSVRTAEPGGYLAVLTRAQTNRIDQACSRGGFSASTAEFCALLKDEIASAEDDDAE